MVWVRGVDDGRPRLWLAAACVLIAIALAIIVPDAPGAESDPRATTTVSVDGQQPWSPTGVIVKAGQEIHITATGMINYCSGGPQCDATPDGSVSGESHCGGPTKCGGLIGRIGIGAAFAVGSDFETTAASDGALELGINDFDEFDSPNGVFDNNSGSFRAKVEIETKGSFIEGTVKESCETGSCTTLGGVKITARGPKQYMDRTMGSGHYLMKVKKGTYDVKATGAAFDWVPESRTVKVGIDETKTANFTAKSREKPPTDPLAVATIEELETKNGKGKPQALFIRDGQTQKLGPDTQLRPGDIVKTGENTVMAIEFAIGGKVGINPNGEVKIRERSATDLGPPSVTLQKGGMWAKCQKLKEPLEIQAGGGVMGIKG